MSSKDRLEDVCTGSEADEEIQDILQASYLDPEFETKWQPAKIQIIRNENLLKQYEEKKQEFFVHGHKSEELEEKFGFIVENNVARLEMISELGFHVEDSEYNALGYNCMGVYLCRFFDVCLQHALVKFSGSNVVRIVICKFVPGRQTSAIPRVASAAEFIEPTQGFDSHVSVIQPSRTESLQSQFDRSQIYLYEINKLLQPTDCPRHILPFAFVTFTLDGIYNSAIDAEPTNVEKLANNPQLQSIIKRINAKNIDHLLMTVKEVASNGVGGGAPMTSGQVAIVSREGGKDYAVKSDVGGGGGGGDGTTTRLQHVINELNAKLEAEEMKKFSLFGGDAVVDGKVGGVIHMNSMAATFGSNSSGGRLPMPVTMPTFGMMSSNDLMNAARHPHPQSSSVSAQYHHSHAVAAAAAAAAAGGGGLGAGNLAAYGLLKPCLSTIVTSQQNQVMAAAAGFLGPTQQARPAMDAAMAAAGYINIPGTASFYPAAPQNAAIYHQRGDLFNPMDFIQLDAAKNNPLSSTAGFYQIPTINPSGFTMVSHQGVKRSMALNDLVPFVDKRAKFF